MIGIVILFTLFSILTTLSIANRRWMMFALLLFGGMPFGIFSPGEVAFGLAFGGVYLFVVLCSVAVVVLFTIPQLLSFLIRFNGYAMFLFYGLISLLWTPNIEYGVRVLLKLASPFLFLVIMQSYVKTEDDIKKAERIIIACCIVEAILALVNTFGNGILNGGRDVLWISKHLLSPAYMGPANFSCLIGIGALISLVRYLESKKNMYLVMYIVFAGCIFWAFVRITMAGLVIATVIVIMLMARNYFVKYIIPLSIVMTFIICFFTVDAFRTRMFFGDKIELSTLMHADIDKAASLVNTSGRSLLWGKVNKEFLHKEPLLGSGVGAVDYWLDNHGGTRLHGEYLRILSDLGVVGLLLYIYAMLQFVITLAGLYFNKCCGSIKISVVVAFAGLIFYLTTLATDNSLNYISEFGLYVYSLLAFVLVKEQNVESSKKNIYEEKNII